MWAFTILCLTAVSAEFTVNSLEEMSASMKSFADTFQSNVDSNTQLIKTMYAEITQSPSKMAQAAVEGADSEAKAKKGAEALEAKMCKVVIELSTTTSDADKKSQEMMDNLSKFSAQYTEMAKDPSKLQDLQKMTDYTGEITQANSKVQMTGMSAKGLANAVTVMHCKDKSYESSFTRLFAMEPVGRLGRFHVPSVVLGAVVGAAVGAMAAVALYRANGKTEVEKGSVRALMEEGIVE